MTETTSIVRVAERVPEHVLPRAFDTLYWFGYALEDDLVCSSVTHFHSPRRYSACGADYSMAALLRRADGTPVAWREPVPLELGRTYEIHARDLLQQPGELPRFHGMITVTLSPKKRAGEAYRPHDFQDLVSRWTTRDGISSYRHDASTLPLNDPERHAHRNFRLDSPQVMITDAVATELVLLNPSTSQSYSDEVSFDLILQNVKGETLSRAIAPIPPFGVGVIDLDSHFGGEAIAHLASGGGYGVLRGSLTGAMVLPLVVWRHRRTGSIWRDHTRPPRWGFQPPDPLGRRVLRQLARPYRAWRYSKLVRGAADWP